MIAKSKNGKRLIARNDALDKRLKKHPDLDKNIETLFAIGKRNRRLIKLLYISVILEVIMSITITYLASQVVLSKNRIENTHISLVNNCKSGNDLRKDNLALWTYILNIPPPKPPTKQQEQITIDFKSFIKNTFALRDCSKL